jgi:HAD superfamily hydrolase (TIGR01549 family)
MAVKIRGVIFDLDGTLIKDNSSLEIFNEVLVKRGKTPLTPDKAERTRGTPIVDVFRTFFPEEEMEQVMRDYVDGYKEKKLEIELIDGIEELLLKLVDWGLPLGLVTNRGSITTGLILDCVGLSPYFRSFVSRNIVLKTKPDPEPFLKAMDQIGTSPEETVVIGDTHFDIEGGKRARTTTILVKWWPADYRGKSQDYEASTPEELDGILTDLIFPLERRGAEAEIRRGFFRGREAIMKRRVPKNYRNCELDLSLRRRRTKAEARLLGELKKIGIALPYLYDVDLKNSTIIMEEVRGKRVKEFLDGDASIEKKGRVLAEVGELLGVLHKNGIVHGDPTTSNMILSEREKRGDEEEKRGDEEEKRGDERGEKGEEKRKITLIDLGLGEFSESAEDRGVDLHLLKEVLYASNPELSFEPVVEGYLKKFPEGGESVKKIDEIEGRGRYR